MILEMPNGVFATLGNHRTLLAERFRFMCRRTDFNEEQFGVGFHAGHHAACLLNGVLQVQEGSVSGDWGVHLITLDIGAENGKSEPI